MARRGLALLIAVVLPLLVACAGGSPRPNDASRMMDELLENAHNGAVSPLAEPRFSRKAAREGLWHPRRFIDRANAGIYLLAPHDPTKTPVLFVHGYDGSPRDFTYLIARLNTTRFEAWVYNYPSGLRLPLLAAHLESSLAQLQRQFGFRCVSIVAHSMGGLVARGFLLRNATAEKPLCVPLFVSISTPWAGSRAARWAPDLVSTWRDLASGSAYLQSLFAVPFPDNTLYHLVYTSDDRTVGVASQLRGPALQEATQVIGYDATHVGVLRNTAAASGLMRLLEQSTQ